MICIPTTLLIIILAPAIAGAFYYLNKSNIKRFISCNDWYKLSSIIFMLGNIDIKEFLKVSNIIINATKDIMTTKMILK